MVGVPRYVRGSSKDFVLRKSKLPKILKKCVVVAFLLCFSVGCVCAIRFAPGIFDLYRESSVIAQESSIEDFRTEESSYLYAANGKELVQLKRGKSLVYVEYCDIPYDLRNAFIAIEDKRFYKHHGVDWLSTAKATYLLLRESSVVRGGSTITQQLARNVYLNFDVSYERKLKEIFLALELEKKYSKSQILEFYVNNINYGNGYFGIGAAAKGYFDKEVGDLSLAEIALLCAIPNNPTLYNPKTHLDNAIRRRNLILSVMYEQGFLNEKRYKEACLSKPVFAENTEKEEYYDFAVSYAIDCAIDYLIARSGFKTEFIFESDSEYELYLQEYQRVYEEMREELYTGGYKVYTSIDLTLQAKLQSVFNEELIAFSTNSVEGMLQGAAIVLDNKSGCTISVIGGRTDDGEGVLGLNRAFQSYRQPGSAIKPLVVYGPAFENGFTNSTIVEDRPIDDGPKNSGDVYAGRISIREAVAKSKNVVAWQLMEQMGIEYCLSFLHTMEFKKIVPSDYCLPASLGGLTYGVTVEEMAGGYCAIANNGVWRNPTCITGMINSDGKDIFISNSKKKVFSSNTASELESSLFSVQEFGTAKNVILESEDQFACKTGTTNDNRTGWFCGYTEDYTVAVYVGMDDNTSVEGLSGSTCPASVWRAIQNEID